MKLTHFFLLFASLLTLSGCAALGVDSYPSPIPADILPTAIYQTAVAANATMFALTPSATPTYTPSPTFTPTATFTPTVTETPTGIPPAPNANIVVDAPGPMSKVASPLKIHMYVVAGQNHLVDISLFGEDGRLIAHELDRVQAEPPTAAYLSPEIPFEVRAAELGRLQIVTKDLAGRIDSLSTTFILLLPVGQSEINPPPAPYERAFCYNPAPDSVVSGGLLNVQGAIWPLNDQSPIIISVQDETGRVLISKILSIVGDTYIPFAAEIPYQVTQSTPVRLSIQQSDPRVEAVVYVYSQLITLAP